MEQDGITPGKEKAWLMQVTANQCRSLLRSVWRKRTEPFEEEVLKEEIMFEQPVLHEVWECISKLKPKYRVVVYLFYYEGYSVKEIGELTGRSEAAVSAHLSRGAEEAENHAGG